MMNIKRYIQKIKKYFTEDTKNISASVNRGLVILYVGTFLLILLMMDQWQNIGGDRKIDLKNINSARNLFVDELLLSPGELQLGRNPILINITLNELIDGNVTDHAGATNTPARNRVYSKILEQKVKKAESQPLNDFELKPLPK